MTAIAPPPGSSAALAAALQQIETQAETAVADLARLVAVDTSFPPGSGYDAFADLMEDLVAPLGLATSRVRVPEADRPPELRQTGSGALFSRRYGACG
jgi:succinyl-diaminopimelate desuccinylase